MITKVGSVPNWSLAQGHATASYNHQQEKQIIPDKIIKQQHMVYCMHCILCIAHCVFSFVYCITWERAKAETKCYEGTTAESGSIRRNAIEIQHNPK